MNQSAFGDPQQQLSDFGQYASCFTRPIRSLVEETADKSSFRTTSSSYDNSVFEVQPQQVSHADPPKYMTQLNEFTDMQSVLVPELISVTGKMGNLNRWI